MDCEYIKNRMAAFLSGSLDEQQSHEIQKHLMQCFVCQKEMDAYKRIWEMLGEWGDADPERSFLTRFWNRMPKKTARREHFLKGARVFFNDKQTFFLMAVSSMMMVIGIMTLRTAWQINRTEVLLTALSAEEIEFVKNLELVEHLDFFQHMDLLEDGD